MSVLALVLGAVLFIGGVVVMDAGTVIGIAAGGFAMIGGALVLAVEMSRW